MSTKRKLKPGSIELDKNENAIIINYSLETSQVNEHGDILSTDSEDGQKRVRIRDMNPDNIPQMAKDLVSKCKYVHASRTEEIEELLRQLCESSERGDGYSGKKKKEKVRGARQKPYESMSRRTEEGSPAGSREVGGGEGGRGPLPFQQGGGPGGDWGEGEGPEAPAVRQRRRPLLPDASPDDLEDYIDKLYEEKTEDKVMGAKCLLRLSLETQNLELLVDHDSLVGILARVLREEGKKSTELAIAIAGCFLCWSHFSEFHEILRQNQCGDVTIRVLDFEAKRDRARVAEVKERKEQINSSTASPEEKQRLIRVEERRLQRLQARQSRLLYACSLILLNLAEDLSVERKMVKRNIISILVPLLDRRECPELLLVTLTFLKKLCIFEENKNALVDEKVPQKTVELLQLGMRSGNPYLTMLTLRVLYNLSFSSEVRSRLVETGILQVLVELLKNPPFRQIVLRILYHFSFDQRAQSLLTFNEQCVGMVLQLVVAFPERRVGRDLVALVVNLSLHPRGAERMVSSGLMPQVVGRVLKLRDATLCKVIRGIVAHPVARQMLMETMRSESLRTAEWVRDFVRVATQSLEHTDMLVEVLGLLAHLEEVGAKWVELCEIGLLPLIQQVLVGGLNEDDLVLECIQLVSTIALAPGTGPLLASSDIPAVLHDVLSAKQEDDEMVLQLLFCFFCLIANEATRGVVFAREGPGEFAQITTFVLDLLKDRHPIIRQLATETLNLIGEVDPVMAENIRVWKFQFYNQEWCALVKRQERGGGFGGDDSEDSGGLSQPLHHPGAGGVGGQPGMGGMGVETPEGRSASPHADGMMMRWDDARALADRYWGDAVRLTGAQ
uniref:Kinesin-associated protein 3 n=1 Tax=Chromera velia CCMP2878 TaxID=1169474 RepID=A0A0G4GJD9_9ALVE|eukprot:Cvel_22155.t1-p1 / transcript=Cvel_22155.t1 / gene=Cvel_22155 / organism=Chromera_velia_CCMP2878 / gene_product=Kinesin-associated protein 3, putative / transcript_product=Kinesin-associated protein 3, putative / location=Cvel_scaffold2150:6326-10034(+) / protein_length=842 / sequence_SO=supercontig / SO=protein_coding / is_pseudo=false